MPIDTQAAPPSTQNLADDRVTLVPGDDAASPSGTAAIGRVVAVGGSHVVVQFSSAMSGGGPGDPGVTVGTFLGIWNGHSLVIGALCEIMLDKLLNGQHVAHPMGKIDLLGEILPLESGGGTFQRGVSNYPRIGHPIVTVDRDELQIMFDVSGPDTINVGTLQQDSAIGAYIAVDDMVSKHFAIFGSTGAGKSSGVALILREIMAARSDLRILLIDPHNEYGACFEDKAHVVRPGNLQLPYWLFNFEEIVEVIFGRRDDADAEIALLAELIPLAKSEFASKAAGARTSYRQVEVEGGRYTVDTPVPYRLDDVVAQAEARMGKLENRDIAVQYQRLLMRLSAARKNPRYSFIFDESDVDGDSMIDILSQLFRLQSGSRPMTIMQLAGFPTEIFDAIVSVLFRLAFEFGLWSDGALPLLIVCEEAHNYANVDRALGFRPAREALSRIAKEGRKYGVFLGLITQRPAQLDHTLISQCSTVFAMRMANEDDQRIVHAAVSDPANRLLGFLASLGTREALAFGAGVPVAMRLRFKELPEAYIPRSEAVWGRRVDSTGTVDRALVASVVARWRGQAASNRPRAELMTAAAAASGAPADDEFGGIASWSTPDLQE
jgi:DNA helicase HerA-like ATPase